MRILLIGMIRYNNRHKVRWGVRGISREGETMGSCRTTRPRGRGGLVGTSQGGTGGFGFGGLYPRHSCSL